jgi:hypothetical protein
MQDAAAFVTQDQTTRRLIQIGRIVFLVLFVLLVLFLIILKRIVGVRVWKGGAQEVVRYWSTLLGD